MRLFNAGFPVQKSIILINPIREEDIEEIWSYFQGATIAVRSSMINEDTRTESKAGKFKSIIGITTYSGLRQAVREVESSADDPADVSILIQEVVNSLVSGVMFSTTDPDNPSIYIEASYGLGETIVGGLIKPDKYIIFSDGEIKKSISTQKSFGIFLDLIEAPMGTHYYYPFGMVRKITAMGEKKFIASIPFEERNESSLSDEKLNQLVEIVKELETFFESPQDVEFAFDNDKLIVLQSRPITKFFNPAISSNNRSAGFYTGDCASLGDIKGVVCTEKDLSSIEKPFIYVGYESNPNLLYKMNLIQGIVTEWGGMLCHSAIVARELNIPCIVGAEGVTEALQSGDLVHLNANEGYVKVMKKHGS